MEDKKRAIIVGKKNSLNYSTAVLYRFGEGAQGVTLRAQGKAISIAFAAANMALSGHLPLKKGDVRYGQETLPDGKTGAWVEIEILGKED